MTTLEKIRAEIEEARYGLINDGLDVALKIIDKYAEQEPCDDAISRQAVLDELNKWEWQELYLPIHFKENIIDVVPSVRPQEPNAGKWVDIPFSHYFKCSECDKYQISATNYCPNCGARMVEPQESEDKE